MSSASDVNHGWAVQKGATNVIVEPSLRTFCSTRPMREKGGLAQPFSAVQGCAIESTHAELGLCIQLA